VFTGIVEELGTVVALVDHRLTVRGPRVTADARPGDSIAVNGVCLTVVTATPAEAARGSADEPATGAGDPARTPSADAALAGSADGVVAGSADGAPAAAGTFTVDVMPETLRRSALGALAPGDPVNLERAATAATRLGGHLVQGHVDAVGVIRSRAPTGDWEDIRVTLPAGLSRYVVEKGSIAVDGVSLTVVEVTDDWFQVSLIPTTRELTTLGRKRVGDPVNLEVDVIAKYVEKLVAAVRP
jgi:riboflavin synthase